MHADSPEQTDLGSGTLLSLEADLSRGAGSGETSQARAARLEADQRLVDVLRSDGFQGARYDKAAARWWSYGWRIMVKWTRNGEVFHRSRQVGRPVPADMITTAWNQDDRYQVATDSVIGGMELFRERGLIQGKWTPQGGASLTTYFVGASIRSFRPAYMTWFRSRQMGQAELDTSPGSTSPGSRATGELQRDIPDQRATDPYYAAATYDELARVLPHITDPQVREGLGWRALGYTQAEAAERIGLTEKALERRLSRARARIMITYLREPELGEGGTR
nr:sigma-70 region 4 domain-containing protein [Streptomyces sp. SID2888]